MLRFAVTLGLLGSLWQVLPVFAEPTTDPRLESWAGQWTSHSMVANISPDGVVTINWRTYRWCNEGLLAPCDAPSLRVLGGYATLAVEQITESPLGDIIGGPVAGTTDMNVIAPGFLSLRKGQFGLAELHQVGKAARILCGPRYATEAPDEVKRELPCGV